MKHFIFASILVFAFCFAVFAQGNKSHCPSLRINSFDFKYSDKIAIYKVEVSEEAEQYNVKYVWEVNGGKLLAGQGTDEVAILREDVRETGNVKVEIKGLPKECSETWASDSFIILDPPSSHYVDKYGTLSQIEEKKRLDEIFVALQNQPLAKSLIKLRKSSNLFARIKFLDSYLIEKGFNKSKVIFAITEQSEEQTEFWIIPIGAEMPDCKDCLIIKGEDFEKLENLFLSK